MWTYLAAAHALEILKAQHAAILEYVANLKERAFIDYSFGSMEPTPYAAREEPMSPKAMPEGLSASLPLLSFWLVVDSSRHCT